MKKTMKYKVCKYLIFFFISLFFLPHSYSNELYEINAEKIIYKDGNKTVIGKGDAIVWDTKGKQIKSSEIIYFKNLQIIKTVSNSEYSNGKIKIKAEQFVYDINKKIIEALNNVVVTTKTNDVFYFKEFTFFELEEKGLGNKIEARLEDGSSIFAEKASLNNKTGLSQVYNSNYTTCLDIKNEKGQYCPAWSLKTKKTVHDKNSKMLKHSHAVLKLKNIPIFYTPYISHPDPTVKRKSGFLPPVIKTLSDVGRTVKIPYFWAISDDKDLTITPTYYFKEKNLYQTSYRQAFKTGILNVESGYSEGYANIANLNRTSGSRSYNFAKYESNIINNFFLKNNKIDFQFQKVSQENFLRVNKINTSLFSEDIRFLDNFLKISTYDENKNLELKTGYIEDLQINDVSKYTYLLPEGNFYYKPITKYGNNINFSSNFISKKFDKDQKQTKIHNQLAYQHPQKIINKIGLGSILKINILNNNIYNNNVTDDKPNDRINNYFTLALDNSLPFAKFKKESRSIITPRIFAKYTSGKTKEMASEVKKLELSDIYSINRSNNLIKPETGLTFGQGIDFSYKKNKINSLDTKLKTDFGIGYVYRSSQETNMPLSSSLNNKSSDFVGNFKLSLFGDNNDLIKESDNKKFSFLNDFNKNSFNMDYKFTIDNDFSELYRNILNLNGNYKNFYVSSELFEESAHIGGTKNLTTTFKKLVNPNNYLLLESKKNLETNQTEFYNFGFVYETDCIRTSLVLNKNFYTDKDLNNNQSLIFSITLKPFSDDIAPDLSNFFK